MLRRTSYILITLLFIMTMLVFQFIMFNVEGGIDSAQNRYQPQTVDRTEPTPLETGDYIIITGRGAQQPSVETMQTTFSLLKLGSRTVETVDELSDTQLEAAQGIVVCTSNVDAIGDVTRIIGFLERGKCLVFAEFPSTRAANFERLRPIMGITRTGGEFTQVGFDIYEGIFIGGQFLDRSTEITNERVFLTGQCKIYAVMDEDVETSRNHEKNPLLWRTIYNDGALFVVNAPFMDDLSGMGILTSFLSIAQDTFVYPIVNAKMVFVKGMPTMTYENDDYLKERYNRNSQQFVQDLVWPDLVAVMRESDLSYSAVFTAGFGTDYDDETLTTSSLSLLHKEFAKVGGEICFGGYAAENAGAPVDIDSNTFLRSMRKSLSLFEQQMLQYKLYCYVPSDDVVAAYNDDIQTVLPSVRSVAQPLSYANAPQGNDALTYLPIINEGFEYRDTQNMLLKSVATTAGLISYQIDLREALYPVDPANGDWRFYSIELAKNFWQVMRPYMWVDKQTASLGADRIERYNRIRFHMQYSETEISVWDVQEGDFFIIRTPRKVVGMYNCDVKRIERGVYLVSAQGDNFRVYTEATFE